MYNPFEGKRGHLNGSVVDVCMIGANVSAFSIGKAVGRGGGGGLYLFTNAIFTPGTSVGRAGPSLAVARAGLTGTGVDNWKNNTNFFNTSNGIQLWTVPADGDYRIQVYGAGGGTGEQNGGIGSGARITGIVSLIAGNVIKILAGQKGGNGTLGNNYGGGGGGGSYVTTNVNSALIVAGGGNGGSWSSFNVPNPSGLSNNSNIAGGTNGGVGVSNGGRAGGGGGLTGNGFNDFTNAGGNSFTNGANGGDKLYNGGVGGFGGGGGSQFEGGGGGGYSGGTPLGRNEYNTLRTNYGAGSFNSGTSQSNFTGGNVGNGSVTITLL